ncbi:MAG: hypothetical protein GX446_09090 [Chthonomonadales bacterium]|nr:hypothetical protein [Chthonomonadales bacterium]
MRSTVRTLLPVLAAAALMSSAQAQLHFSTYLGGTGNDYVHHVTADVLGNIYVTGRTSAPDFPTTAGAYSGAYAGGDHDVFVAKLDPTGSTLIWSTLLGGAGDDQPAMLALDSAGNVLVVGTTSSTDFPVTGDALQPANAGGYDAFLARLSPDGSALIYATYLGGAGKETVAGLVVLPAGQIIVAGTTASADFPTTVGAFQTTYGGGTADYGDMFAAKLAADAKSVVWSTFVGGAHDDECRALGLDDSYNVVLAGWTAEVTGVVGPTFPVTIGAYDTTYAGDRDVVVTKLSNDGSTQYWGTFLGDTGKDQANNLVVADGGVIVTGDTASAAFPTTFGAYQTAFGGVRDVFVAKVASNGDGLVWSTFLGGSQEEGYGTVGLHPSGDVIVGGYTLSANFPVTAGCFQPALAGQSDSFLTRLTPDGSAIAYSTFFGGTLTDRGGAGVTVTGDALLVGFTASPNFPITPGAFQTAVGAGWAGYVARLSPSKISTKMYVPARSGAIGQLIYLRGFLYHLDNTPVVGRDVDFSIDGTWVGSAATSATGRATLNYVIGEGAGAGTRVLMAAFAGDAAYNASAGSANLTVSKGTLNVWVLSRTVARGTNTYLRAYLRRYDDMAWVEGKLLSFTLDGTPLGSDTTIATGRASILYNCPVDAPLGVQTIGVTFAGDGAFNPASGTGTLTVTP